mgnify:CR=1 FL=1
MLFRSATNPFGLTDVGFSASPTFVDIDGDGDLDAFVGNKDGNTLYYRNNAPILTIAATNASQTEGNTGTKAFTFTVTRSGSTSGTSSANWQVTGSGTNPANAADFGGTLPSGTVTFAAGETQKVITVNVSGDTTIEPDEGFTVTLSSPTNAAITTATATGTINNDDSASITINDVTVTEGNSGTTNATFTVTLSNPVDTAITLDYATANGTATTADSDYVGITTTPLTFNAGETSKTITVAVNGDTKVESNETFLVNLSNLQTNGRNVKLLCI